MWSQISDVVAAAFDQAQFDALADRLAFTATQQIEGDPIKVVEVTAKKYGFNDDERNSVLRHLIAGGDLTQYGLHAAVTRSAENLVSYDRASEFERVGGKIIELPANDWKVLAKAA